MNTTDQVKKEITNKEGFDNNISLHLPVNQSIENNEVSSQINENNKLNKLIKVREGKMPYNGCSETLIAKIFIIGYEKSSLSKSIKQKVKQLERDFVCYDYLTLEEKPILLNMFLSHYCESHDISSIIDFFYPDSPKIYEAEKMSTAIEPERIVFTLTFSLSNRKKISLHYFGYCYYKSTKIGGKTYYCPRTLCFMSQYPYFQNYIILSEYYEKNISLKYLNELWLYHLVNLPAPINLPYRLIYFPSSELNYMTPLFFQQLSGYPLLQFKVPELFYILPISLIIEIFIFSFLEIDMIFFSENLEVLNIVMFIFAYLNYPLNESFYYHNIVSVSLETFKQGKDAYLTKANPSMFGVNASYDKAFDVYALKQSFFIVDIEKKEIEYKTKKGNQDCTDLLINNIIQEIKTIKSNSDSLKELQTDCFKKALNKLYVELVPIGNTITMKNSFFNINEINFYDDNTNSNYNIISLTQVIQEKFYSFIIDILSQYYLSFSLQLPSSLNSQFSIQYNESISASKGDKNGFKTLFKQCSKYNIYINLFFQLNITSPFHTIPLQFIQEFIHYSLCNFIMNKDIHISFAPINSFYEITSDFGLLINLDHYFNSSVSLSLKTNQEENNFYSKSLFEYIILVINMRKIKKKTNVKIKSKELYYYYYYQKDQDALRLKHQLNLNCFNITNFESIQPGRKLLYEKRKEDFRLTKGKLILNKIYDAVYSEISFSLKEKLLQESKIHFDDVIYCSYVLFFILSKQFNFKESFLQFKLIVQLIQKSKYIYSSQKYLFSLIFQLIHKLKQQKEKEKANAGNDDELKHVIVLISMISQLNLIPHEELLINLNDAYTNHLFSCEDFSKYRDILLKPDDKEETKVNYENNIQGFLKYNFSFNKVFQEDYFMQLAKNTTLNGNLYIQSEVIDGVEQEPNKRDLKLRWNITFKGVTYSTPLYSPLKIYNILYDKYSQVVKNGYAVINLDTKELCNICLMLIFYVKNMDTVFYSQQTIGFEKKKKDINSQPYLKLLYDIFLSISSVG